MRSLLKRAFKLREPQVVDRASRSRPPARRVSFRGDYRGCQAALDDSGGGRIHLGCGPESLDGWLNVNSTLSPATDAVFDSAELCCLPSGCASWIHWNERRKRLDREGLAGVVMELRRILAPGGRLTVASVDRGREGSGAAEEITSRAFAEGGFSDVHPWRPEDHPEVVTAGEAAHVDDVRVEGLS